jgi:cutinase
MQAVPKSVRRRVVASLAIVALAAAGASCSRTRPGGGSPGGVPTSARPATTAPGGGVGQPGGGGGGTCPSVQIITARGTGESQSNARGLSGLDNGIASKVPGTQIYQVVYPATADFLNSATVGTKDALAKLTSEAAACPSTKFFLTGYSQGGMVLTGLLQQLPAELQGRIAGGVIYGNPYYKGGSPSAQGPDKSAQGIIPTGIPAAYGSRIHDYCMQGDTVCGSGAAPGQVGLPTSGISAAHLTYPNSEVERQAISWAVGVLTGG